MSYESAVLALSAKVFLKFDETSGSVAADSSGNGYHGTHFGGVTLGQPSLLGDGSGKSVSYNGSTGFTSINTPANLNTGSPTVNTRLRATATNLSGLHIIAARWSGGAGYLWLFTLNNGKPEITLKLAGVDRVVTAPTALTAGDYTLGFTYDASTLRLYVNGSQVGSLSIAGTLANTTTEFEVARAAAAVYGNVQVDGFAYWMTALSAADMATLHSEATSTAPGGALAVTLPKPTVSATGAVQNSGSLGAVLPLPTVAIDGSASDPRRVGFGLVLDSMTPTSVIPPTSGDAPVPLHITTPTVPAPALVDGRPS